MNRERKIYDAKVNSRISWEHPITTSNDQLNGIFESDRVQSHNNRRVYIYETILIKREVCGS